MNNKAYLIVWDQKYADEFDLFGFDILSEERYNALKKAINRYLKNECDTEFELYFGTNKSLTVTFSIIKKWIENAKELDINQASTIIKTFGFSAGQHFVDILEETLLDYGYLDQNGVDKWGYVIDLTLAKDILTKFLRVNFQYIDEQCIEKVQRELCYNGDYYTFSEGHFGGPDGACGYWIQEISNWIIEHSPNCSCQGLSSDLNSEYTIFHEVNGKLIQFVIHEGD